MRFEVTNNVDIDELDFSVRTYNCLRRVQINTVQNIVDNYDSLNRVKYLGYRGRNEVIEKIKPYVKNIQ